MPTPGSALGWIASFGGVNFRSVAQLSDQVLAWSKRLPRDIEVVVGVPRSGLLVANLLALYRNIPLTDVRGLFEGRSNARGRFFPPTPEELADQSTTGEPGEFLSRPRSVLVVDDSIWSGGTMRGVRAAIESQRLPHSVRYAAMYATDTSVDAVDFHGEVLDTPRVFEWNLFRNAMMAEACLDMDGVLCDDPDGDENDDGPNYERFLCDASPRLLPGMPVGWIVTARLERYRPQTEAWLARHGVEYGQLLMLDYPDGATRRRMGTHSAFKADAYRRTGARLFLESSVRQAVEIAELARRDVICTDTMQLVRPGHRPVSRASKPVNRVSPQRRLLRRVLDQRTRDAMRRVAPWK